MTSRVRTVDSVCEDRDGVSACGEGSLVCSAFDPIRATGDHNALVRNRRGGEFAGNMVSVCGGRA
ncbi:hypothetical protein GCM10010407_12660 [Rarobacter incanus]